MLLSVLDLTLDVKWEEFHSLIDGLGDLRLSLTGQLAAIHCHVGQVTVIKVHGACLVQAHLLFLEVSLLQTSHS